MNGQRIEIGNTYDKPRVWYAEHHWTVPFVLVLTFLVFEFAVPQVRFPILQPLRILLVLTVLLASVLVFDFVCGKLEIQEHRIKLVLLLCLAAVILFSASQ